MAVRRPSSCRQQADQVRLAGGALSGRLVAEPEEGGRGERQRPGPSAREAALSPWAHRERGARAPSCTEPEGMGGTWGSGQDGFSSTKRWPEPP